MYAKDGKGGKEKQRKVWGSKSNLEALTITGPMTGPTKAQLFDCTVRGLDSVATVRSTYLPSKLSCRLPAPKFRTHRSTPSNSRTTEKESIRYLSFVIIINCIITARRHWSYSSSRYLEVK